MISLIKYEVKNAYGNVFSMFFGIVFPIGMTLLFYFVFKNSIPGNEAIFSTQLFIRNLLITPLSIVLIGFASSYSQEIENGVMARLVLFGFNLNKQLIAKFLAQFIMMIISVLIYSAVVIPIIKIQYPTVFGLVSFIITILILSFVLFVISYSIATLSGKFGITYSITMLMYFVIMAFSGMMGIPLDLLPSSLQTFANALPTTYIASDFPVIWTALSYDFMPLAQSFLILSILAAVLYFFALRKGRHIM